MAIIYERSYINGVIRVLINTGFRFLYKTKLPKILVHRRFRVWTFSTQPKVRAGRSGRLDVTGSWNLLVSVTSVFDPVRDSFALALPGLAHPNTRGWTIFKFHHTEL
jgi:hypothetical protein